MNKVKHLIFLLIMVSFQGKTAGQGAFNPANTIIACDIDDVVIKERENGLKSWFLKPSRWGFALALSQAKKRYNITDAYPLIDRVVQKHPKYAKIAQRFKKRLVQVQPVPGMRGLVTRLVQEGYTVIPASNMTTSIYKGLLADNKLPAIFNTKNFFIKTKKCNQKHDGRYYAKPNAQYYKNLKQYIARKFPQRFTNIIFIDDKKENVRAACKEGIFGIRFKNDAQLRIELQRLGIKF